MIEHPAIELFVIGAIDHDDDFVAHVSSCEDCAAKLADEARLELALFDVRKNRIRRSLVRRLWPIVLVAAAIGAIFVGSRVARAPVTAVAVEDTPVPGASEVIATLRPQFRRCYQDGLAIDPKISGSVVIQATVSGDGNVRSAVAISNTGLPEAVTTCLAAVVRSAHFAATGHESELRIPVTFAQTAH